MKALSPWRAAQGSVHWVTSLVLATALAVVSVGCSEDSAQPQQTRSQTATGSQDFSWIDIELSGFPAGALLVLRPSYWSTAELTADPQARITAQSATVFRVEFLNLASGNFAVSSARILMAVESVVDELQGIVVLCDETGPIIIAPECQGNCAPLCGLPGHDCDG